MFVDEAKIHVTAGPGGAGCRSFRREAHVPRGGPDGGDGGRGADVVLEADGTIATLLDYHYKRHFKGNRGIHGKGSRLNGANGDDLVLKVPLGTIVYDDNTGERLADLTGHGERAIIARGGRGGRGNIHFVTPTRRAPAFAELGEPAEERWVRLEMKLLADAALVGFPSVGKSSLIARMSAARPKIADYPFTTLAPNLGVVRSGNYSYVVADVPGLIEGASEGKGLGHAFLRHIERTAVTIHVVDLTGGYEDRDVIEDVAIIERELAAHADELAHRPYVLVGNKVDIIGTEEASDRLEKLAEEREVPYFAVSAVTSENMEPLILRVGEMVREQRQAAAALSATQSQVRYVHRRDDEREFHVIREDDAWRVVGKGIERMVIMTEMGNDEALAFLQKRLAKAGVEKALENAGARDGDEIRIAGVAFEFEGVLAHDEEVLYIEDEPEDRVEDESLEQSADEPEDQPEAEHADQPE